MRSHQSRLIASLVTVVLMAGVLVVGSNLIGHTSSACLAKNTSRANLKDANGASVGRVTFGVDSSCKTKVVAELREVPEGFHGFHIHTTGVCDAAAGFAGAGAHWNKDGGDHGAHTGDMPPVLGMDTGAAELKFLTDRFRVGELVGGDGSAVILHADPDNLAHIPATTSTGAERYHSHQYDTAGPDEDSRKTGDAGTRYACGVVKRIEN